MPAKRTAGAALARRTRKAQKLPAKINDKTILAAVAVLLERRRP